MKKKLFGALFVSLLVIFGAVTTASAFSFGLGTDAKADAGVSAKASHSLGLNLTARLAKLQANFEARVKKLGEKTERQKARLSAQFEKKMEEMEEKFEKKNNGHSTSTPVVLEVGAKGNVLMRGTVVSNSTSALSVKSWGGPWTVNVASTTVLNSENRVISDLEVGDYVGIQGKINTSSNFTIDARLLHDRTR